MSSVTRSTQNSSSETTTKKKFGKNLNKLTKPPAPPSIPSVPKTTASSRNGLLLLSTKRSSSSGNAVSSSGGILSNKPSQSATKPLPSLGLQYESSTSTHDALLGAVVGASRAEAQQQPDAWGVADKKPTGDAKVLADEPNLVPETASNVTPESNSNNIDSKKTESNNNNINGDEARSSNWDEYGGRKSSGDDAQGSYMSQLAKDRAEKLRLEEETRQNAQKERASQRLRELEQKMLYDPVNDEMSPAQNVDSRVNSPKSKFVLERLGRSQSTSEEKNNAHGPSTPSSDRGGHRSNHDSNRTYSSLVGGGNMGGASKNERDTRSGYEGSTPSRNGRLMPGAYSADPAYADSRDAKYSRQPMIHLSSYEDRDRGERGSSAGPRMLYDPKSGSMVAVPSREDTAGGRGRKDRGKKGRNSRDKDSKSDSKLDSGENTKGRKGKQRRDENGQHRGKESSKGNGKKGSIVSDRKLPRTCGVLYARDNKGNFYCADGCDGDLGYGAHSVPGGRTKNPDAYAQFTLSQQQMQQQDNSNLFDESLLEASYDTEVMPNDNDPPVTLHTGFSVLEPQEVKHDWVKPNEKIELITGIDDSPTLQATAKEWAPSQAALAAAVAAKDDKVQLPAKVESEDEEDDDGPFGLGFDPTLNMDSVMQSPSADPADGLHAVDLAALSLEPAMKGPPKSDHIFAFGSGATWGTSNPSSATAAVWGSSTPATTSNAWGVAPTGNAFAHNDPNDSVMATSFLSISANNTWGGVPGLGAASLGGSSLNGEHSRSTGD